jgi:hypothetical protein
MKEYIQHPASEYLASSIADSFPSLFNFQWPNQNKKTGDHIIFYKLEYKRNFKVNWISESGKLKAGC